MTKPRNENNAVHTRSIDVSAAGCRLRVKCIEPEATSHSMDPFTIVFLHEGLGCIETWRDFPEALCKSVGCHGVIYERKGYGQSERFKGPWPVNYLQIESLVYLPALLKELSIEHAVLVGHSDGGTIALLTAASHRNLVKGIITEAAHIFVEQITIEGIHKAVQAFETTSLKEKLARYHKENTKTLFYRWADRWLSSEYRSWNIRNELPKITCPVLLLQGEDDEYGTRAQVDGIAGRVTGPVQVRLIPDCGHIPHFQAKDAVLSEMTRFVNSLF
jgi:pimeloyl-ACP methyl ester carboxylesterase